MAKWASDPRPGNPHIYYQLIRQVTGKEGNFYQQEFNIKENLAYREKKPVDANENSTDFVF